MSKDKLFHKNCIKKIVKGSSKKNITQFGTVLDPLFPIVTRFFLLRLSSQNNWLPPHLNRDVIYGRFLSLILQRPIKGSGNSSNLHFYIPVAVLYLGRASTYENCYVTLLLYSAPSI